jgi:hypothetical protein
MAKPFAAPFLLPSPLVGEGGRGAASGFIPPHTASRYSTQKVVTPRNPAAKHLQILQQRQWLILIPRLHAVEEFACGLGIREAIIGRRLMPGKPIPVVAQFGTGTASPVRFRRARHALGNNDRSENTAKQRS